MKNFGFKVGMNGKELVRAGFVVPNYVVTCSATAVHRADDSEEVFLSIGGLDSVNNQHVVWLNEDLKIGDIVTVELIDNDFSEPKEFISRETEEDRLRAKIEYYYQLKEELKDHLDE